jgi:hypothetical protein
LATFLSQLNKLELWGTDIIRNAYLEATTKEKGYIIGGPEFDAMKGILYWSINTLRSKTIWSMLTSPVL